MKFGVVSDTHLNSKYSSLDFLYTLYDRFEKEKVDFVVHCGDMTDGEGIAGNLTEVLHHGAEEVIDYVVKVYPKIDAKTYFISGRHDATYIKRERIDICAEIANKRKDLVYICTAEDLLQGIHQGDINIGNAGNTTIKLLHPLDRQPYASSYPVQKIVQSFGGGHKPQILIVGAYHKIEQLEPREVCAIQAGSTQYQTAWRLTHKLPSVLGGSLVDVQVNKNGSLKQTPTFTIIPFYE